MEPRIFTPTPIDVNDRGHRLRSGSPVTNLPDAAAAAASVCLSSLVSGCIANLNQRDVAKQLLTPLRLIARMNFSLKNYSCELFNLTGTVGKVDLISAFTIVVCESWNVSDLG